MEDRTRRKVIRAGLLVCAVFCLAGAGVLEGKRRKAFELERQAEVLRGRLTAKSDELMAWRDALAEAIGALDGPTDERELKTWWAGLTGRGLTTGFRTQGDGVLLSASGPFDALCAAVDQLSRSAVGLGLIGLQYVEIADRPGCGLLRLKVRP